MPKNMYTKGMSETGTSLVQVGTYNRLGSRTFWLFLSQKIEVAGTFLILGLIFSVARSLAIMPKQFVPMLGFGGVICFVIFIISLIVSLISSWIVYKSHEFCLASDALKIKQGIMTKQELAIPYRQIQNVSIERGVMDQILGVSKIVIETAGHDEDPKMHEAEGILPAMDKNLAEALQEELLKRADVQKVIQANL